MPVSKRPENLSLVAFAVSLVFLFAAGFQAAHSGSRIHIVSILPFVLATVFSFTAWWHAFLVRRENEEKAEQDRIARDYASRDDIFADDSEELKLAANAHQTFDRWFLTVFTVITGLLVTSFAGFSLATWQGGTLRYGALLEGSHLSYAGIGAFMVLFGLLLGSYFNGLSREPGCRFLRPVGAWMLFGGVIYLLGVVAMLARHYEIGLKTAAPEAMAVWDLGLARVILLVIVVLGIELVLNFILEFYRPRTEGEEEKPLYESKVLSFFTEPGSVAQNVADSLDYQFGIKVSQTWFYRFMERSLVPLICVMIVGIYLMDCVVMVNASERGVRETYLPGSSGEPAILEPGLYFKLPRPFQVVRHYEVEKIHEVTIGHSDDDHSNGPPGPETPEEMQGDKSGRVIVWNKTHFGAEEPFLVAAGADSKTVVYGAESEGGGSFESVPVNFISLNVQVAYKIKSDDLLAYAYGYENPKEVLARIARRELIGYLATHDLFDLLGANMVSARDNLQARITNAVASHQPSLGVEVVFVGLSGVHPPPEVGETYQQVVGAPETARAQQLKAEGYAYEMKNQAYGEAERIRQAAESYKQAAITSAEGRSKQFVQQLAAYRAAPDIYLLRRRLSAVEDRASQSRKFFISGGREQIMILDLTEKPTLPLDGLEATSP